MEKLNWERSDNAYELQIRLRELQGNLLIFCGLVKAEITGPP